jgi:hypothetical protein
LRIILVCLFVGLPIIRHQAEVIQVSGNPFQHADHPRLVEANKFCLDIRIDPKIHDYVFPTLQSLQPINAASQRLNFSRQAGSDLGFRLRLFSLFLWSVTSARLSQLAQPDWDPLGFDALKSWWIRLELSPVAPAILRIDRPA